MCWLNTLYAMSSLSIFTGQYLRTPSPRLSLHCKDREFPSYFDVVPYTPCEIEITGLHPIWNWDNGITGPPFQGPTMGMVRHGLAQSIHGWALLMGSHGLGRVAHMGLAQIHVQAQSDWACPLKFRTGPDRARYLGRSLSLTPPGDPKLGNIPMIEYRGGPPYPNQHHAPL